MATYRVELPSGAVVHLHSLREVAELERLQANGQPASLATVAKVKPSTTTAVRHEAEAQPWLKFCKLVGGEDARHQRQRQLLALVKEHSPKGITIRELTQATEAKNANAIGGVLSGLRKVAAKAGLNPDDLFTRDEATERFQAGTALAKNDPPAP